MASQVQNIIELLGPREVIRQAIAVLMEAEYASRDVAFAMSVRESCSSRRPVREVAAAIVEDRCDSPESTRG
jgi:AmiR/NasT family two-component response regulator